MEMEVYGMLKEKEEKEDLSPIITEAKAAEIISQLFSSLKYLKSNNIDHKNVNPKNSLLTVLGKNEKTKCISLKLRDYGESGGVDERTQRES